MKKLVANNIVTFRKISVTITFDLWHRLLR